MKNYVYYYFIDTQECKNLKRTDYIQAKNRARAIEHGKRYVQSKWNFIVSELRDDIIY